MLLVFEMIRGHTYTGEERQNERANDALIMWRVGIIYIYLYMYVYIYTRYIYTDLYFSCTAASETKSS